MKAREIWGDDPVVVVADNGYELTLTLLETICGRSWQAYRPVASELAPVEGGRLPVTGDAGGRPSDRLK